MCGLVQINTNVFSSVFLGGGSSRQLSVSAPVDVAEVLEHQPESGAQSSLSRAGTPEVLATGNDGRGDF